MADNFDDPYRSWTGHRCHPNAPCGGGGTGTSSRPGPRGINGHNASTPHPGSPASRYLTPQQIAEPTAFQRVESLLRVAMLTDRLSPAAIVDETSYQLGHLLKELLPMLAKVILAIGLSGVVGAALGGVIGALFGGVGAVPGAVIGFNVGVDVSTAIFGWLGLGFLVAAIGDGLGELAALVREGATVAWNAPCHPHSMAIEENMAAQKLARANAVLVRLILQGLIAYVTKNAALQATRSTAGTLRQLGSSESAGALGSAKLAELDALLDNSKLPKGFVDWVKANWEDIRNNPKLNRKVDGTDNTSAALTAETPSQVKRAGNTLKPTSKPERPPVAKAKVPQKPEFSGDWGKYKTNGLKVDPRASPEGRRLIIEFQKKGLDRDDAIIEAGELMKTGSTLPQANPIEVGDKFFKVIPEGGAVGKNSAFWATEGEISSLKGLSHDQIADKLGLPLASQQGTAFEVVSMKALSPGTSFTSKIAGTTEIGANGEVWSQAGGGLQTLITDRSIFSAPIGTGIKLP